MPRKKTRAPDILPPITRRDFLNGVALSVAAGLTPRELLALDKGAYPPALTGLRGNHPGSFEAAHVLAWQGIKPEIPREQTDDVYDLVVVGGGLSGLAAAYLYQQWKGGRVLVLDNHDDFGGHAKRNEFTVGGESLIGYGGSQSIDKSSGWSKESLTLLDDIGIQTDPFYEYFDQSFFERLGMRPAIYFDERVYGQNVTVTNALGDYTGAPNPDEIDAALEAYPIGDEARAAFKALLQYDGNPFDELSNEERIEHLRSMSYTDYLGNALHMPDEVVGILRDNYKGIWGLGWDALSALEAWRAGQPGTAGLDIRGESTYDDVEVEPYIFHFPDGNAAVARAIVRQLIPAAIPGKTQEDLVLARVDYDVLDVKGAPTRLRLNALALDMRNTSDGRHVDVTYVRDGRAERVRARRAIMAGYINLLPHLCGEVAKEQVAAIKTLEKVPITYLNVAVRSWRAFAELGTQNLYIPKSPFMHQVGLDFPVSMGGYEYTKDPGTPTVLHGTFAPAAPDLGLTAREQFVAGRARMYDMRFEDYEREIVRQLDGALGKGGFDAERDIAAITVNRWPHGYAYEYIDLYDPPDYGPEYGPHIEARRPIGRISVANSDSQALSYINGAFDAAHRAVREQLES